MPNIKTHRRRTLYIHSRHAWPLPASPEAKHVKGYLCSSRDPRRPLLCTCFQGAAGETGSASADRKKNKALSPAADSESCYRSGQQLQPTHLNPSTDKRHAPSLPPAEVRETCWYYANALRFPPPTHGDMKPLCQINSLQWLSEQSEQQRSSRLRVWRQRGGSARPSCSKFVAAEWSQKLIFTLIKAGIV